MVAGNNFMFTILHGNKKVNLLSIKQQLPQPVCLPHHSSSTKNICIPLYYEILSPFFAFLSGVSRMTSLSCPTIPNIKHSEIKSAIFLG